jgi:hypothetical protein
VRDARCEVRGARCRVQGARCQERGDHTSADDHTMVRGAGCKVRGARNGVTILVQTIILWCEVRGARCGVQGARCQERGDHTSADDHTMTSHGARRRTR